MRDFLTFRTMLTPILIQILFWLSVILCVAAAIYCYWIEKNLIKALVTLIIGPILSRIVAELFILFFRMNETMTEMNNKLTSMKGNTL